VAFDIPPAGAEVVAIIRQKDTEFRTSSNTGNRYLNVKAEVLSTQGRGYYLFYTVPEGQYQASFLGRLLDGIGIDTTKRVKLSVSMLHNKRFRARIKHETRDGKTRAIIHYFLRYDPAIDKVPDITPQAQAQTRRPVAATEASQTAATQENEDVPF
jgi:hypothetical protein